MEDSGTKRLIHTYGRRRGRRLRQGQRALLETLLPQVEIPGVSEPLDPTCLFANRIREVWLEIGFGGGEHLAAQAAAHPDIGIIGCEPFVNGVVSLLAQIQARQLANVRIWEGDARALMMRLPEASIARAFVLFPDPWPKARHHKRRLIASPFLDALARILAPGAELRVATDDADYLAWIREQFAARRDFGAAEDRRERPADWPSTRYEQKAVAAGRKPAYLRFLRTAGAAPENLA